MPKPVCVSCQRFFRPKKNGRYALEMKPTRNNSPSGTAEPDAWEPYKLWRADEWECQGCGATILVGFALQPVAHDYQKQFEKALSAASLNMSPVIINDC